jgi:hypothetical protein
MVIDMVAVLVTKACELSFSEGVYKVVSKVEAMVINMVAVLVT